MELAFNGHSQTPARPQLERGCFSQKSKPLAGVGDASQWSEYGRLDPRQRADARHLLPSL